MEAVAFPMAHKDLYDLLKSWLKVLHAGVRLGEWKGKDWQPSHTLAMSTAFRKEAFPTAELTYEQAVAYLRKEAVTLSPEVSKGYVVLAYRGQALGFAKISAIGPTICIRRNGESEADICRKYFPIYLSEKRLGV